MENYLIENEVVETQESTSESSDSEILLSINDNISHVYNSVLITTCLILSFSLYMFFHNITKRKEI